MILRILLGFMMDQGIIWLHKGLLKNMELVSWYLQKFSCLPIGMHHCKILYLLFHQCQSHPGEVEEWLCIGQCMIFLVSLESLDTWVSLGPNPLFLMWWTWIIKIYLYLFSSSQIRTNTEGGSRGRRSSFINLFDYLSFNFYIFLPEIKLINFTNKNIGLWK